jgi:hypothetical protein
MKMTRILLILALFLVLISCEEVLLEDDISKENVHLIAPGDSAQFFSTGVTFTWDPIENGTQYRIQIAKPDFENPLQIITDNVIDTTSYTTQLNVGGYEWRVQGINSGYSTSYSTRSFTVVNNEDFAGNSITLSSPNNNLVTNTPSQNLIWQPVIGATNYHFQVTDISGGTVVYEQDVAATNFNYNFGEGNFQWKIRASNGQQNTLYASRSILVDITSPNVPVLTSPTHLTNTSDHNVTFQWTRTGVSGSSERDSLYIYTNNTLTSLEYKNTEMPGYNTSSLDNGSYYWLVKSFDAAGNSSARSSVFSLTLN